MTRHQQQRRQLNRLYNTPANRRLKHIALATIGVGIALLLSLIIWMDSIPPKMELIMRGCAGLCAIAFVVVCAILVYRVNRDYISGQTHHKQDS